MDEQISESKLDRFIVKAKHIVLSPFRLIRFLCLSTGAFVLSLLVVLAILIFSFFHSLPKIEKKSFKEFKQDAITRTGKRFKIRKNAVNYRWTPVHKINRELLYSIIMSEDATYFEHNGVNFNAMIDSVARNIRKRAYESGASTITQQVVKNVYLSRDKSLLRKIKEIIIARDLEARFTKNEILEVYLNITEFGPEIYGVQMASKQFFKKAPDNITAEEGAYLALMLPSPRRNYFSIHQNKFLNKKNRKKLLRILRDMRYLEYIGPSQYKEYRRLGNFKGYAF